jgi:hypothetical protein
MSSVVLKPLLHVLESVTGQSTGLSCSCEKNIGDFLLARIQLV